MGKKEEEREERKERGRQAGRQTKGRKGCERRQGVGREDLP